MTKRPFFPTMFRGHAFGLADLNGLYANGKSDAHRGVS
jgi:hypothetical protein